MYSVFQTCCTAHSLQTDCHQLPCEWIKALKGQKVFKNPTLPLTAILILPILGRSGGREVRGRTSNCVNSSGNCVWPLTVSVIASLLQYFAWQSERLTPEGCRPGALCLTGKGAPQSPTCSPPRPLAAPSHRWSSSGRDGGRVGGCGVQQWSQVCRLSSEGLISGCLAAPGQPVYSRELHQAYNHKLSPVFSSSHILVKQQIMSPS